MIGIPKERKKLEFRVALTPSDLAQLHDLGLEFILEEGAGLGSGFDDELYVKAGARIVSQKALYQEAQIILKVKEPIPEEWPYLKSHHVVFSYLHLAAYPELTQFLLDQKITALAFETYTSPQGGLPLLKPMSQIAGRVSLLAAAQYLQKPHGGVGALISGLGSVEAVRVLIVGAGNVGREAARVALGLGAHVTLMDPIEGALDYAKSDLGDFPWGQLETFVYEQDHFHQLCQESLIIVGAALLPGGRAPILLNTEDYALLEKGTILVDVSIDQGGCFAHSRATTHDQPIYEHEGIMHYGVANIPGAVPRTSSQAISHALVPVLRELTQHSLDTLILDNPHWRAALNTQSGHLVLDALK